MNIIDFFRADFYYRSNRISKFIPINIAYAYMKVGMIVMIIFVIGMNFRFPNRQYYKIRIIGRVEQIERGAKNWNIKVGSDWYFVQSPAINYIETGCRIVKMPDSWVFTVYDSLGTMIYQDSIQTLTFRLIEDKKRCYGDLSQEFFEALGK